MWKKVNFITCRPQRAPPDASAVETGSLNTALHKSIQDGNAPKGAINVRVLAFREELQHGCSLKECSPSEECPKRTKAFVCFERLQR